MGIDSTVHMFSTWHPELALSRLEYCTQVQNVIWEAAFIFVSRVRLKGEERIPNLLTGTKKRASSERMSKEILTIRSLSFDNPTIPTPVSHP